MQCALQVLGQRFKRASLPDIAPAHEDPSLESCVTKSGRVRNKRASLPDLAEGRDHPSADSCHARNGRTPTKQRSKRASVPDLALSGPNRLSQTLSEWENSVKERHRIEREGRSQGRFRAIDSAAVGGKMAPVALTPSTAVESTDLSSGEVPAVAAV